MSTSDKRIAPRVAVQGDRGCFSEAAARTYLGDDAVSVHCRSFAEVIAAVESGRAEYAVVPIENSIAGPVTKGRAALEGARVVTMAMVVLPIEQCLLTLPGAPIAGVRRVISHPVALAQCGRFLAQHRAMVAEEVWDTAGAAREVAERGDPAVAAIAGRQAAEAHGLVVAVADIGDRSDNATTFVVTAAREGSAGS